MMKVVSGTLCVAGLLLGGAQATILVEPARAALASPAPVTPGTAPLARLGTGLETLVTGKVPQYSAYSQSETAVQHLYQKMEASLREDGFQKGWQRVVGGQGVETWYDSRRDQTVICVRWSTDKGYAQSVYLQPGRLNAGEFASVEALGETAPPQTLEEEMQAFSFNVGSEAAYQAVYQEFGVHLKRRGFNPAWTRHLREDSGMVTYATWYHPDLDMTVLCMSWPSGGSHGQTVVAMNGKLRANEMVPTF